MLLLSMRSFRCVGIDQLPILMGGTMVACGEVDEQHLLSAFFTRLVMIQLSNIVCHNHPISIFWVSANALSEMSWNFWRGTYCKMRRDAVE
jgi:hypothetical protein